MVSRLLILISKYSDCFEIIYLDRINIFAEADEWIIASIPLSGGTVAPTTPVKPPVQPSVPTQPAAPTPPADNTTPSDAKSVVASIAGVFAGVAALFAL